MLYEDMLNIINSLQAHTAVYTKAFNNSTCTIHSAQLNYAVRSHHRGSKEIHEAEQNCRHPNHNQHSEINENLSVVTTSSHGYLNG